MREGRLEGRFIFPRRWRTLVCELVGPAIASLNVCTSLMYEPADERSLVPLSCFSPASTQVASIAHHRIHFSARHLQRFWLQQGTAYIDHNVCEGSSKDRALCCCRIQATTTLSPCAHSCYCASCIDMISYISPPPGGFSRTQTIDSSDPLTVRVMLIVGSCAHIAICCSGFQDSAAQNARDLLSNGRDLHLFASALRFHRTQIQYQGGGCVPCQLRHARFSAPK